MHGLMRQRDDDLKEAESKSTSEGNLDRVLTALSVPLSLQ